MRETTRHREAYAVALGAERSIERLHAELAAAGRTPSLRTLYEWSRCFHWQDRLAAFEHRARAAAEEAELEAIREMHARQVTEALLLQQKGAAWLQGVAADAASPEAAIRAITEGAKLERLVRGVPTERTEAVDATTARVEGLADDELHRLLQLAEGAVGGNEPPGPERPVGLGDDPSGVEAGSVEVARWHAIDGGGLLLGPAPVLAEHLVGIVHTVIQAEQQVGVRHGEVRPLGDRSSEPLLRLARTPAGLQRESHVVRQLRVGVGWHAVRVDHAPVTTNRLAGVAHAVEEHGEVRLRHHERRVDGERAFEVEPCVRDFVEVEVGGPQPVMCHRIPWIEFNRPSVVLDGVVRPTERLVHRPEIVAERRFIGPGRDGALQQRKRGLVETAGVLDHTEQVQDVGLTRISLQHFAERVARFVDAPRLVELETAGEASAGAGERTRRGRAGRCLTAARRCRRFMLAPSAAVFPACADARMQRSARVAGAPMGKPLRRRRRRP